MNLILTAEQKTALIDRLTRHIIDECKSVDVEERYCSMIDECYSFEKVGGPFESMTPSRVLKEVDPIAYRCGLGDYGDSDDNLVEIGDDYYEIDEVETAKEGFLNELRAELAEAEKEVEELESEEGRSETETDSMVGLRNEVARRESEIETVESHSF